MGQFKPMVKMMTTEPSVILKLKKGGKVAKKMDGGYMPMQSTMPAQAMPARGGLAPAASPMAPSLAARRRAMMAKPAMNPNMMKKGGKAMKHEDAAEDRAMIKKALAGKKFADGGSITDSMAKTTVKGNAGKFLNTMTVDGDKNDSAKGTGGVKNGNKGGYANGGTISGNAGKFLNTKVVDGDKNDSAKGTGNVKNGNGGGYAMGGTIKGGNWENRPADTAKAGKSGGTTGGVKNGNGGGYKMGGTAKKAYATGGIVDTGKAVKLPSRIKHQPVANTMQSGTYAKGGKVDYYTDLAKRLQKNPEKPNLRLIKAHTGPKGHVAKVYKDKDYGEHRVKFFSPEGKHYAEGDYHTDDLSDAHDTAKGQLNRYKTGGTAKKYADGDLVDASKGAYEKSIGPSKEDMDMAKTIRNIPSKLYEGAKSLMGVTPKPAGSVTKTEKSVTVSPASKKRGGRC
jgi:hypothetical protein